MRSAVRRRPAGSGTARSSSPTSKKQSGSERGNPVWTPSDARGPALSPICFEERVPMTTAKDVLKMMKDNDVKYVDFRFTDPRGKWQHEIGRASCRERV